MKERKEIEKSEYVVSPDGLMYWYADLHRPIISVGILEYQNLDFTAGPFFMSREFWQINKFNN